MGLLGLSVDSGASQPAGVEQAGITTGLVIASIALSALAYLTRPKPDNSTKIQAIPSVRSIRGSKIPVVHGRQPVSPIVCWDSNGRVELRESGAGKGIPGTSGPKVPVYFQDAWHALAIGPGHKLHSIKSGGKPIWEGPITRDSTPSGTEVVTDRGTFVIYWGEVDQPVDAYLADSSRVGIASAWPAVMYVLWKDYELGQSPQWGNLVYEIEVRPNELSSLSGSTPWIEESAAGEGDDGVNPAYAFYQLTTGPWPWGANVNTDKISWNRVRNLGALFQNEHTPVNFQGAEGETISDIVSRLMADFGFVLPQDGRRLAPLPVRHDVDEPPLIGEDMVIGAGISDEIPQGRAPASIGVWDFRDREKNYRPNDVQIADDAESSRGRRPVRRTLTTVISRRVAARIADLQQGEVLHPPQQYSAKLGWAGRRMHAGQSFRLADKGRVRVISRVCDDDRPDATVRFVSDSFGRSTGFDPGDITPNQDGGNASLADESFHAVELPYDAVGGNLAIAVLRAKDPESTSESANVYLSSDNATYTNSGLQVSAGSGTLAAAWGAETPDETFAVVEDGPIFDEGVSSRLLSIASNYNLTASPARWYRGDLLLAVVDEDTDQISEIMFCRQLSSLGGGQWQAKGVIRERSGTTAPKFRGATSSYASGSRLYVIPRDSVSVISAAEIQANSTLYVKSVPIGVAPSDVTPHQLAVLARALAPPPAINLLADFTPANPGANDVDLYFMIRVNDGNGLACGEQVYGAEPFEDGEMPDTPAFNVLIEFLSYVSDAPSVVGSIEVPASSLVTVGWDPNTDSLGTFPTLPGWKRRSLTPAEILSIYGVSNPSHIRVRVSAKLGAYKSNPIERTFPTGW